jgi:hypothetical protein
MSANQHIPAGVADASVPPVALPGLLTPVQLLRQLDWWLANTGYDECHPWRLSILSTLAQHGGAATPSCISGAADLFNEIAEAADDLHKQMLQVLNGSAPIGPAILGAAHIGWLADAASVAHGGEAYRCSADAWLLSPRGAGALHAARRANLAEGETA